MMTNAEPDTSDIPEADENWFKRAKLRTPYDGEQLARMVDVRDFDDCVQLVTQRMSSWWWSGFIYGFTTASIAACVTVLAWLHFG